MDNYTYLNVNDLIEKGLVADLYIGKFGLADIGCNSIPFFNLTRDANINAYYFMLVDKGNATLEIDMRSTELQKSELVLFNPFSVVSFKGISVDFSAVCLFIDRVTFERIPNYSRLHGLVNKTGIDKIELNNFSFRQIRKTISIFSEYLSCELTFKEGHTLVLSDFLLLQISEVLFHLKEDADMHIKRKDELIQQVFNLIADHHMEQHGLRFYADRLCISTTYLSRIVREITHRTAYYYIAEKLFFSAHHLLACTDLTVAEVANRMNFSDQSAFGKFFKSKAGISPALYRKKLGKE